MASQANIEKAIIEVYKKLTGKMPKPKELSLLVELQSKELIKFRKSKEKMKGWLDAGYYTVNPKMESALIAANAVVASVILNSDATLTKR
jgi:hypothetical protein